MDPTLLQHSTPFDFPISSESKYLGQERSFSNPSYSATDYSFSSRRPPTNLSNGAAGPPVPLPANSSLEFNVNSLLNDTPYHSNSQLLLSPPDSTTGSASASANTTAASLAFTTLPKPFPSNATASDQFSTAPSSVLSSNWSGSSMTVMDRSRFPPPLSPPLAYNSANGIGTAMLNTRPMADRLPHAYTNGHSTISSTLFHPSPSTRYSHHTYHRDGLGHPFPTTDTQFAGSNMSPSFSDGGSTPRHDGPPFGETKVVHQVLTMRHVQLLPEIHAHIQKGFFQVDQKWTCYRRNYFAVSCSFAFKGHLTDGPFYIHRNGRDEAVQQFAVSISAKTASTGNSESEARGLVQHTPKRDKATETVPGRLLISPTFGAAMANNGVFPGPAAGPYPPGHLSVHPALIGNFSAFESTSANSIPYTQTFERIQFQKATANNGKRRAQQQYFLVVVELSANIGRVQGEDNWVVIATKESDPMVVRGRSPGHYKDGARRDSQASMDHDRGNGHGGETAHGSMSSGGYGHAMDWVGGSRSSGSYGGSYHRHVDPFSPASLASSSTLTGTPTDMDMAVGEAFTARSARPLSSDQAVLTPTSEVSDELFSLERKRGYDDGEEDDRVRYHVPGPFADNVSGGPEFSATPYSKLVCASS